MMDVASTDEMLVFAQALYEWLPSFSPHMCYPKSDTMSSGSLVAMWPRTLADFIFVVSAVYDG